MTASPALVEYMKWWESGYIGTNRPALLAYQCSAGKWTLGWGDTEWNGRPVRRGDTCTLEEAEQRFVARLDEFFFEVAQRVSTSPVALAQHQLDALTSLAYNIGLPRFKTSSPRILAGQGLFDRVGPAIELWNKKTDPKTGQLVVEKGLVRRRAADRAIWDRGDYSVRP